MSRHQPMTDQRRAWLRDAKQRWRKRHPEQHAAAARRYRMNKRLGRLLLAAGVGEADLRPWLEQLGTVQASPWRARTRDLWDAWRLACEHQHDRCIVCKDGPLVAAVRDVRKRFVGACCERCARVLSPSSTSATAS
jgi:hypothetical protein